MVIQYTACIVAMFISAVISLTLAHVSAMEQKAYPDIQTFTNNLSHYIAPKVLEQHRTTICRAASMGRRRFQDKLGWLTDFQEDIATYAQLVEIVHTVEKQVKQEGLNRASQTTFVEIGKMVLTIPVFTSKITSDLVKRAMESVRRIDVEEWSDRVFGQSTLSKRRVVFDQQKTTQKLCEKPP